MSNTHKCMFWCGKIIEFSYAENIHQLVSMTPIDIEVGCRAVTTGKLVSPRLSNTASCSHAGGAHVGSRRRSSRAWGGGERDHQPQRSDGFSSHPPRPVSLQRGAGPARLPFTRSRQAPCVRGDGSSSGPHSFAKLELLADDDIDPNRRLAEVIERTEATHPSNNILLLLIN